MKGWKEGLQLDETSSIGLTKSVHSRLWRLGAKGPGYYEIQDEKGRIVPFVMNDAQRSMMRQLWYWNIILKARQHGISTLICMLMLDACLFAPGTRCGIVDATIGDAEGKLDKIKFAYDKLGHEMKEAAPLRRENNHTIEWRSGSRIDVGVSHRGGTLQLLHISEMGKTARDDPKRSREIRSGAFGTVHEGMTVFVESTAAGAHGDYYDLVQLASKAKLSGKPLSKQEFKLIFLPWHDRDQYRADPEGVVIPKELAEYFAEVEHKHGVKLDAEQRAWYAVTRDKIGSENMWSEFPAYPDEAFKVSLEGAVFRLEMTKAREQRRVSMVPIDPSRPVNTFWDIGKGPNTAIWFHQSRGQMHHLVHYYQNSSHGVDHYAQYLREIAHQRSWTYGTHYGPHDLDHSAWVLPGTQKVKDVAREHGIEFTVVPRVQNKRDAIETARSFLAMCWIDEEHCTEGIKCLDAYSWVWDDNLGRYKDEPSHNWASHGADALMCGACGFEPDFIPPPRERYTRRPTPKSAWAA